MKLEDVKSKINEWFETRTTEEVFDLAITYNIVESDYLQKLKLEETELGDKIDKLSVYINSREFNKLHKTSQNLLRAQLCAMQTYREILILRLNL